MTKTDETKQRISVLIKERHGAIYGSINLYLPNPSNPKFEQMFYINQIKGLDVWEFMENLENGLFEYFNSSQEHPTPLTLKGMNLLYTSESEAEVKKRARLLGEKLNAKSLLLIN